MNNLTLDLNGTRIGRSSLPLKTQEYLTQLESDVVRLENQLWQLVELRPAQKASYCDQWWAMIGRMEKEAAVRTGLTVAIETPGWVLLMGEGRPVPAKPQTKGPYETACGSDAT